MSIRDRLEELEQSLNRVINEQADHDDVQHQVEEFVTKHPKNARGLVLSTKVNLLVRDQQESALKDAALAVELRPDAHWAWLNLAKTLAVVFNATDDEGKVRETERAFRKVIELNGDQDIAYLGIVQIYSNHKSLTRETFQLVDEALKFVQGTTYAAQVLYIKAKLYKRERDFEKCIKCCEQVLELNPSHELAKFLLQGSKLRLGCPVEDVNVANPPVDYVRKLYDTYADKFDDHLVNQLQYQTPVLMLDVVKRSKAVSTKVCVDLGCGTGLCAKLFREQGLCKGKVIGVDLSPRMVQVAKNNNIFDEVYVGEICAWLETQGNDVFDMIVACDVVVYLGDLSPLFRLAQTRLAKGGIFAFSTEASKDENDDSYHLQETRRFVHGRKYIENLQEKNIFELISASHGVKLRLQQKRPVLGNIYVFMKK